MANSKIPSAAGLAAATLTLIFINVQGGPTLQQPAGLSAAIVVGAIALTAGASVVSRRKRSFAVTGYLLLVLGGAR